VSEQHQPEGQPEQQDSFSVAQQPAGNARAGFFRRRYGAGPIHLLGLLLCFAVAGYSVFRWYGSPNEVRLVVWFVGALVFHDFILFPLYSLLDRALGLSVGMRRGRVPAVNYLRVPLLLSGLLLLLFFPLIFNKSEPAYQAATGLDTSPYLTRWLGLTAVFALVSLVLYGVRLVRAAGARKGADANSRMPASKATEADHPSS
jgi:hypothetical protein